MLVIKRYIEIKWKKSKRKLGRRRVRFYEKNVYGKMILAHIMI